MIYAAPFFVVVGLCVLAAQIAAIQGVRGCITERDWVGLWPRLAVAAIIGSIEWMIVAAMIWGRA